MFQMTAFTSYSCLLFLVSAFATTERMNGSLGDEQVAACLKTIRSTGDRTPIRVFHAMCSSGSEDAFDGLIKAIGWLRDPVALGRAYECFRFFRDSQELAERAAVFLVEEALTATRKEARSAAVAPLRHFGAQALGAYEEVLLRSKDESVRRLAIGPVIPRLLERRDRASLELILDNASASTLADSLEALRGFSDDGSLGLMVERVAHRKTDAAWRLILIATLVESPPKGFVESLKVLLRDDDPMVQVTALEALARLDAIDDGSRNQLERMYRSPNPHIRVAVVNILSRLRADTKDWWSKLVALSHSSNPYDRIAAVLGFSRIESEESTKSLIELLSDDDWRVRLWAIAAMDELRRHAFVEPLIERLEREEGRLKWDVASALFHVTGHDLGRSHATWHRWFSEMGGRFEVPPIEEVRALEARMKGVGEKDATVASFYGIPVRSLRTCFVLDLSGSMGLRAKAEDPGTEGRTRLDVLKEQLNELIDRMLPGSRSNFLVFRSEVESWKSKLIEMNERERTAAREFVVGLRARGNTNLFGGLEMALGDMEVDTIYVLSDGVPSVGAIVDLVLIRREIAWRNNLSRVRIHCISVGEESQLLQWLAEDSGGIYIEVGNP